MLYGHLACPGVGPIRGLLNRSGVAYDYINIHQDREAAAHIRAINNGYESVPTLVFPDGSTLTEPSVAALKAKLTGMGYRVGPLAWLIGHSWHIFLIVIIIFAVVRSLGLI